MLSRLLVLLCLRHPVSSTRAGGCRAAGPYWRAVVPLPGPERSQLQHPVNLVPYPGTSRGGERMSITASEARRKLFPLIEQVNDDRTVVEIVSRRGNAVLMSAEDYAALEETAYLLRSPENVRRLLTAYTDALEGRNLAERELSELAALAADS